MIYVFSDGSHSASKNKAMPEHTKSGVVIKDGTETYKFSEIHSQGWSDVAEYHAIMDGLNKLLSLHLQDKDILWCNDNQFVVNTLTRKWRIKPRKGYSELAKQCQILLKSFKNISFKWIPREENKEADALSKL